MTLRQTAILTTVTLTLLTTGVTSAEDFKSKVDPFANHLIQEEIAVGIVVGIYKNGQRQIIGYGETKRGSGNTPDSSTVYEIGSITKTFTGTILADMVIKGEMALDDPANAYLETGCQLNDTLSTITLLHLATHTSGLPSLPQLEPEDPQNPYAALTMEMLCGIIDTFTIPRDQGLYEYSNMAMGILGNALASHDGTDYESLVIERICKPLKMSDTRITLNDAMRSRLATPYDPTLHETKNWDIPSLAGAGALRSTCVDMLTYAVASMNYDAEPLGASFELAHSSQVKPPQGPEMGLGWHIARDGISRWHNGGTGGYASMMVVIPDSSIAVVVLSNTAAYARITQLGETLAQVLAGKQIDPPTVRKTVKVDPAVLQSYAGEYIFNPMMTLSVIAKEDQLWVQMTGQPEVQIFPESDTQFFLKIVDAQISFVKDESGKVTKLILHQNGMDQSAMRK